MKQKITLVVPEAPAPAAQASVAHRAMGDTGLRLGVLDNGKGNADHLLKLLVDEARLAVPVASVVMLRKSSPALPAPAEVLDQLAREADYVLTAMAD